MKEVYYCLFNQDGMPIPKSVRYLRRDSIQSMENDFTDWKTLKSWGITCQKITINKLTAND